jgi:transcriptional regulator with PAS, ATPase and Fis domain
LQEKEYEPLGATATMKTDARIIVSTNRKLSELVSRGSFREDLFYRLNVIKIELPPLSSRREDIPLLIDNFIQKFNALKGKEIKGVSDNALNILMRYNFPGNIRELENIIEFAFVLCRDEIIKTKHLSQDIQNIAIKDTDGPHRFAPSQLDQAERQVIIEALQRHRNHRGNTAAYLKINKSTLWRKMKKYGIE